MKLRSGGDNMGLPLRVERAKSGPGSWVDQACSSRNALRRDPRGNPVEQSRKFTVSPSGVRLVRRSPSNASALLTIGPNGFGTMQWRFTTSMLTMPGTSASANAGVSGFGIKIQGTSMMSLAARPSSRVIVVLMASMLAWRLSFGTCAQWPRRVRHESSGDVAAQDRMDVVVCGEEDADGGVDAGAIERFADEHPRGRVGSPYLVEDGVGATRACDRKLQAGRRSRMVGTNETTSSMLPDDQPVGVDSFEGLLHDSRVRKKSRTSESIRSCGRPGP